MDPPIDVRALLAFEDAAAGHDGVLTDHTGAIVVKPSTAAELAFYEDTNAAHPDFVPLIPTFMGTLQLGRTEQLERALENASNGATNPARGRPIDTDLAIVLENIASGFVKPNVLDVKLGARLWDDDAPLDKRQRLDKVSQQTTSATLGFRVAGMKTYDNRVHNVFDKLYGRGLTPDTARQAFEHFFDIAGDSPDHDSFSEVIEGVIEAVEEIERVISHQESIMYSSSLLFVYEGDRPARRAALAALAREQGLEATIPGDEDEEDDSVPDTPKLFDVRVIDFAHARWVPGGGPDENMLRGIRSVVAILKRMRLDDNDATA